MKNNYLNNMIQWLNLYNLLIFYLFHFGFIVWALYHDEYIMSGLGLLSFTMLYNGYEDRKQKDKLVQ